MTDKGFVWHDNYSRNNDNENGNVESNNNITYETAMDEYREKYSRFMKIAAVVLSILIILLTVLLFKSRNLPDKKQVETIEKRLDRLEAEFTSLKTYIASKLDQAIQEMERDRRSTTTQKVSPATPPAEQKEQKALTPKVHKVLVGESLSRISRYYGLTIDQLRVYNNLDSNSIIHPGQELKLTP